MSSAREGCSRSVGVCPAVLRCSNWGFSVLNYFGLENLRNRPKLGKSVQARLRSTHYTLRV